MGAETSEMRLVVSLVVLLGLATPAMAQGVLDEWATIIPPTDKPVAKRVSLEPGTTALLVLDLAPQTCGPPARPRCITMLPRIKTLLTHARERHWLVIYTIGSVSQVSDILPAVAKLDSEKVFMASPDKFIDTGLEAMLKEHGSKTVVVVGSASEGAVLETAASAVFRGFDVVVPVDGMVSGTLYAEQYVAWDLTHAPRLAERVTLSAIDLID